MYHMIAPEHPAHLCRSQHGRKRQITPESTNFVPSALGSVQRREQQANLSGADGLADFLKTGNGETGAAGEPDCIAATLYKQGFDAICKTWRQDNRPARRARKKPLRHRAFECLAARRQPQTSARQIGGHVRHDLSARPYDKAQQPGTIGNFTGCDAAAVWAGLRERLITPSGITRAAVAVSILPVAPTPARLRWLALLRPRTSAPWRA